MIADGDLAALEAEVQRALRSDDRSGLQVLGYGEISLVLGWPADDPRWACKRLPPFDSAAQVDAYTEVFQRYVALLADRGVDVLDTELRRVSQPAGSVSLYCVQPVLSPDRLGPEVLHADPARGPELLGAIVDQALDVVDETVGLDAQLSNWALDGGRLRYLDLTTPLVRRPDGTEALDTGLFLASFPWLLRAPIDRFVVPDVIERYHQPRTVVLDLGANLIKERLDRHLPLLLELANERLAEPLDEQQVRSDYRQDARTWGLLQSLRRADRAWQRYVRRRTYPFLLPDTIRR